MEKFEALEKALCKELELIEHKVQGAEMSTADLDKIDKIVHAMKSLATYTAMKEAEEYDGGMSGRRGRSMYGGNSYADGYARGYSEAMYNNPRIRY